MSMTLIDPSPAAVLQLFLSSTAEPFYFTQLCELSTLSRPTLSKVLKALTAAGIVMRKKEIRFDNLARLPRVYYAISQDGIKICRI